MANYASAALVTAQARLANKYNEAEMRRKVRPTIGLCLRNQDYAIPDAANLRKAEQRPVEVHYKLKKAAGSSTVKATRHTGNKGDSDKVTLSWSRITETFSISKKLMQNKVIGAQEVFNHELEQAILNLQDRMETAALAFLYANRCQLLAAGVNVNGTGEWRDDIKGLSVAANKKERFLQMVKTFMYGRHYRGNLDMITDLILFPELEHYRAQGGGNQTNLGYQFQGVEFMPTTDEILASENNGQALIMPAGAFAALPWNDQLNRQMYGSPDSYVGMLTTLRDPFGLPLSYDVSVWTDRADTSGIDGNVQDIKDEYEVSACFGFALPPLSEENDSVVHHIVQGA